jgi:acyl carrier protein
MTQPLDDKLVTVLRRHSRFLNPGDEVSPDADLRDLGVDSMRAIHLVVDIENTFNIRFPDELLTRDTFKTPLTLATAIHDLVEQQNTVLS